LVFFPLSFYTLIRLCKGEAHKDDDTQTRFFLFHKTEFTRMRTFKGKFCSLWIQWQPKGTLNLFFPSSLPSPFISFFAFAIHFLSFPLLLCFSPSSFMVSFLSLLWAFSLCLEPHVMPHHDLVGDSFVHDKSIWFLCF